MKNWIIAGLCFLIAAPAAAALSPVFEIEQLATGGGPCSGAGIHIQVGAADYYACSGGAAGLKTLNATGGLVPGVTANLGTTSFQYWDGSKFWPLDRSTGQVGSIPGQEAFFASNTCTGTPFVSTNTPGGEVANYYVTSTPVLMYPAGASTYNPGNTATCYSKYSGTCVVADCPATDVWQNLNAAGATPTVSNSTPPLRLSL